VAYIATDVPLMPTIEKLSIALNVEMAAQVRRAVDAGEYSSNSFESPLCATSTNRSLSATIRKYRWTGAAFS